MDGSQTATHLLPALAHWAARLEAPPAEAARQARLCLVDTLGCMLAGRGERQVTIVLDALRRDGVSGRSRSMVDPMMLPTAAAAMVNGVAAHALDLDDYEVPGSTHPSAVVVGALLAIARTRSVTLAQFERAYVVGYETICRLGEALGFGHYELGWHATATIGPLGAALAAARLQDLGPEAGTAALSLAASMSAGLKAQFGTDAKAAHVGLAARAGVEAAMMAGAGLTAAPSALEGPHGFLALYGTPASPGSAPAIGAIGAIGGTPAILQYLPVRKPWPSCAYTHRSIDAALVIARRPGFAADRIDAVELEIPQPYFDVCHFRDPVVTNEARFSVVHCIAAALVTGEIGPASFRSEMLERPDVGAMRDRITVRPYPLAPGLGDMSSAAPDRLTVRFDDGTTATEVVADVLGGSARPLGVDAILVKFEDAGERAAAERLLASDGTVLLDW